MPFFVSWKEIDNRIASAFEKANKEIPTITYCKRCRVAFKPLPAYFKFLPDLEQENYNKYCSTCDPIVTKLNALKARASDCIDKDPDHAAKVINTCQKAIGKKVKK